MTFLSRERDLASPRNRTIEGENAAPGAASLEKGLRALVWDGIFSQALGVLTGGALLTGLALSLGASPGFLGLLAAIPFFAQLAHVPAVILIEKLRRRRAICVAATGIARLILLGLALLPLIADHALARILLIAAFAIMAPLGAIGGCAWMSWTCDLVPAQRLGVIFGRRQMLANISGIVAALLGGALVDGWARIAPGAPGAGYVGVLGVALAAALASTFCLLRMPEVPMAPPSHASLRALFAKPFRDANFRRLMGFLGCWNLAVNLAVPFFTVYVVQDLGSPISVAIALGLVSQFANVAALPVWGRLSDRCSNKAVIALCGPLFLCCMLGWVVAAQTPSHGLTVALLAVAQAGLGIASAGLDLAGGNIALKLAPRGEATVFLGANSLVKALCAGIAPITGGALADRLAGASGALAFHWQGAQRSGELVLLELHSWHLFFVAAVLLGAFALTRLAGVEEAGAGGSRAALAMLARDARRLPARLRLRLRLGRGAAEAARA